MKLAERKFEPLRRLTQSVFTATRWGAWAQSLAALHQRVVERPGSPAFALAERAGAVWNISQRWERRAWQISPQIRLSISAVLQQSTAENGRSLFIPEARGELWRTILLNRAAVRSESVTGGAIKLLRQLEGPVFSRLERGEAITTLSLSNLNLRTALEFRRRVVEEKRRVELITRGVVAPSHARAGETFNSTTLIFSQPAPNERLSTHHARTPAIPARDETERQPAFTPPPPPINLDQITEQVARRIDERIVAFRERMGRPRY
jgi:hypothetical protein